MMNTGPSSSHQKDPVDLCLSVQKCHAKIPRLAILATHPIQYHAPWYRGLASDGRLQIKVFFCHHATPEQQASAGFGVPFDWDVSLLNGYDYEFLKNVSARPQTSSFNGLDIPGIKESLRKERFDAVLVNGWNYKGAWQTIWAAKQLGLPILTRGDSHLHTNRSTMKRWVKEMTYPLMLRSFDGFIEVGQWSREYYLHYGAPTARVFHVPHVIDEFAFSAASERLQAQREEIRADWNLPPDATVFLFVGKFTSTKNPLDFIKALEAASRAGLRVAGLMVGDGPLRQACESLTTDLKQTVAFSGFLNQSEILKAYAAADCLVLPSVSETWGMVVNEAMWSGCPCIISDQVGCGPDLVAGKGTGEIFPLQDASALATCIMDFARHPSLRLEWGARARAVIKDSSIRSAVEGTVNAVTSVTRSVHP